MIEKRKHKRLELSASVEIERLDEEGIAAMSYVPVEVTDVSRCGIGFKAQRKLMPGTYYDVKIQIWTKEIVDAVIEVIRREELDDGYKYGGAFIGMSDEDALKIDIYQIFNEK